MCCRLLVSTQVLLPIDPVPMSDPFSPRFRHPYEIPLTPNVSHPAKQKRRQRRREKPGVAGGGAPGDKPRTGKSTREIYLSAVSIDQ